MFKVTNHRLLTADGRQVRFLPTKAMGGVIAPEILVMHWTGANSLQSAVNTFASPAAKASAHLVIGPDGEVVQMVPFNRSAWHAGVSKWGKRSNVNGFSIGIELANAGELQRRADGKFVERIRTSVVVAPKDVLIARHKNGGPELPYQLFPEAQINAAIAVGRALNAAYTFKDIVGHDDIAPGRKSDPGPAFPMGSYESAVLGRK